LKAELQALIASWKEAHRQLLPCPTPEFAANKSKACGLYRWMLELQLHRADCLARAARHCGGNAAEARRALGDAGKALRALPLASRHMKHIVIDKACLRELLLSMDGVDPATVPSVQPGPDDYVSAEEQKRQAEKREEWLQKHPEERDKPRRARVARSRESADRETEKFWSHFPGAHKLLRPGEKLKGAALHSLLRTDGVAVTVLVRKPWLPKRPPGAPRAVADLDPGNPQPLRPQPGQRLVSIDPGRRSMIYAYVEDHGPDGAVEGRYTFNVSTRQMAREARVKRTAALTVATLKSGYVPLGDGAEAEHETLLAALERLPDSRAYESWRAYEAAALPLLDASMAALQRKALRRAKFDSYRARDAAIDRVCLALCRGLPQRQGAPSAELAAPTGGRLPCIQHPPRRASKRNFRPADPALPLLVAFGDGRACSSGLGYCPAPQGRLRHHLARKHGAHVCMIGEYRTSMTCSCCGSVLQPVHRCSTQGRVRRRRNEKSVLWGVKKCPQCRDELPELTRGGLQRWRRLGDPAPVRPPHHWHRDFNATQNMRAIYYSLLDTKQRPEHLRRPEAGGGSAASHQQRGAAPRARRPRDDVPSDRPTKRTKL
jgi:hypothetical protein